MRSRHRIRRAIVASAVVLTTIGLVPTAVGQASAVSAPSVSISDGSALEGTGSNTPIEFVATLDQPSDQTVTVGFGIAGGTTDMYGDVRQVTPSPLTFAPGETAQTITVEALGDPYDEPEETFTVNLGRMQVGGEDSGTIIDGIGDGTIIDDDDPPQIAIGDAELREAYTLSPNHIMFPIYLSERTAKAVTVDFETSPGTALAGEDFEATSGQLTLGSDTSPPPLGSEGGPVQELAVVVLDDRFDERDLEDFTITLTNPTNAAISDGTASGTIIDDDGAGGTFNPLTPTKVFDRDLQGGRSVSLHVSGIGGIPTEHVSAVALQIAVAAPTATGYVSVVTHGRPVRRTVSFAAGTGSSNAIIVPLSAAGDLSVYNSAGSSRIRIFTVGWFQTPDANLSSGKTFWGHDPVPLFMQNVPAGATVAVDTSGLPTQPLPGGAVVAIVKSFGARRAGYLSITPNSSVRRRLIEVQTASTSSSLVIARVASDQKFRIYNGAGATTIDVQVLGVYSPGGTHIGTFTTGRRTIFDANLASGSTRTVQVASAGGIPAGATFAFLNVTVLGATKPSFISVTDDAGPVSMIDTVARQPISQLIAVPLADDGSVKLFNWRGSARVIVQTVGYSPTVT